MRYLEVETPNRTHVPELEQTCWNQMPKVGWRELKLYRFDGTDLYQWFGRKGVNIEARDWSAFEDSATEIFRVAERGELEKKRDLRNLLNRAAAALENPQDLTSDETAELIEDLTTSAEGMED